MSQIEKIIQIFEISKISAIDKALLLSQSNYNIEQVVKYLKIDHWNLLKQLTI